MSRKMTGEQVQRVIDAVAALGGTINAEQARNGTQAVLAQVRAARAQVA